MDWLPVPVVFGPRDCRDMGELFGSQRQPPALDSFDIEIIAEINLATRASIDQVVAAADQLVSQGADVIDVGGDPANPSPHIGAYVAALVAAGHRVSIDSFDAEEVEDAVRAGAELVLSVNSHNRQRAADWGCEVVVIPDSPNDEVSLDQSVDYLVAKGVPIRIDPILEPIGVGFTSSLIRYAEVRRRYVEVPMMMGIGNLTELTDVDSAGVNVLLLAICQELGIHSVLTTQVINWARSAVRECDIARRLVCHSQRNRMPPKRLSNKLVVLRDPKLKSHSAATLESLAASIRDHNYRIFAQDDAIHLISADMHLAASDPFALFDQLMNRPQTTNVDAGHAFYLGFEMAKASIALLLGKQYEQDNALQWGHLTRDETFHRPGRRE